MKYSTQRPASKAPEDDGSDMDMGSDVSGDGSDMDVGPDEDEDHFPLEGNEINPQAYDVEWNEKGAGIVRKEEKAGVLHLVHGWI